MSHEQRRIYTDHYALMRQNTFLKDPKYIFTWYTAAIMVGQLNNARYMHSSLICFKASNLLKVYCHNTFYTKCLWNLFTSNAESPSLIDASLQIPYSNCLWTICKESVGFLELTMRTCNLPLLIRRNILLIDPWIFALLQLFVLKIKAHGKEADNNIGTADFL